MFRIKKRTGWFIFAMIKTWKKPGCGDNCPYIPGLEVQDWPLPDPKGKSLDEVGKTRDKIKELIQELIENKKWK